MTNHDDPVDLAAFRTKLEERERMGNAREPRPGYAMDYGRVIPPPLNPDISGMVKQVKDCDRALNRSIAVFQDEITELVATGQLDHDEGLGLSGHYRDLQDAVDTAMADAPKGDPGACENDYLDGGTWHRCVVNRFADHAKHVYAVGNRDIASLQYRVAELAHTGRLSFDAHERLQWEHCFRMWETLYFGTLSPLHGERTWGRGSGTTTPTATDVRSWCRSG